MGQKGFYFDQTRCTGCRTCSVACSDLHNYAPDIVLRRVIEFEGGTWKVNTNGTCTQNVFAYYTSIGCNECENPVCVKACPTGAHHKRTEDGLVVIDTEKCIGCGMCAKACPYGSPVLDKAAMKMRKCDGCVARTSKGGMPVCVEACPERALEFGNIEELRKKHGNNAAIAPLPDPAETKPCLTIRPCASAKPSGFKGGTAHRF